MIFDRFHFVATLCVCVLIVNFSCVSKSHKEAPAAISEEEKFNQFLDSLNKSGNSELEISNEIRRYLAGKIDLGNSRDSLADNYHKIPWEQLSPFHCIELFEQDRLTAKCGLTSYILAKLYRHAGYESYIYDCGYVNTKLTHQFVLVKVNGKLVVQDSFFDITINNEESSPKDFLQLLSEIETGNFSDIKVDQEDALSECWLNSQAELDSLIETNESYKEFYEKSVKGVQLTDNRLRLLVERNYNTFTTPTLNMLKPRFKEEMLPENFLSLYLKPVHVINSRTGKEDYSLDSLIKSIALN